MHKWKGKWSWKNKKSVVERMERFIEKSADGCWNWTGSRGTTGYGQIYVGTKNTKAHRAMWEQVNGPIQDGLLLCHRCDNRLCVNPDHLFLGTHADNSKDMWAKNRAVFGERHPRTKLTTAQVRDIRQLLASGMLQRDIAAKYGVADTTINAINTGRNWSYVDGWAITHVAKVKAVETEPENAA